MVGNFCVWCKEMVNLIWQGCICTDKYLIDITAPAPHNEEKTRSAVNYEQNK